MKIMIILFLSLLPLKSTAATTLESNTCYIKWNSLEEKEKVEGETASAPKVKEGYVKSKLPNDKIEVSVRLNEKSYLAVIGRSKVGQEYIRTHNFKKDPGFSLDAVREIPAKDLKSMIQGFSKTECQHYRKERLED